MAQRKPGDYIEKLRLDSDDVLASAIRDGSNITEFTEGSDAKYPIGQSTMRVGLAAGGGAADWPEENGIITQQKASDDFVAQTFTPTGIGTTSILQRLWDDSPVSFNDDFSGGSISTYRWQLDGWSAYQDLPQRLNVCNGNQGLQLRVPNIGSNNRTGIAPNFEFTGSFRFVFRLPRGGATPSNPTAGDSVRGWSGSTGSSSTQFNLYHGLTSTADYNAGNWSNYPTRKLGFFTDNWVDWGQVGLEPSGRMLYDLGGSSGTDVWGSFTPMSYQEYVCYERDSASNRVRVGRASWYDPNPEGAWNYGTGWISCSPAESTQPWMFYISMGNRNTAGTTAWYHFDNFVIESGTVNAFAGSTSVWSSWNTIEDAIEQAAAQEAYADSAVSTHNDSTTAHTGLFASGPALTSHVDSTTAHGVDTATLATTSALSSHTDSTTAHGVDTATLATTTALSAHADSTSAHGVDMIGILDALTDLNNTKQDIIPASTTAPATPEVGDLWIDTST